MLKRIVKLLISTGVYVADLVVAVGLRLTGRKAAPKAVVLYYHGVSPQEKAGFESQMELLCRHSIPLDCAHPRFNGAPRYAGVTFDDGFVSVVQNALPILRARQIPSIIFVPTGYLGMSPGWVKKQPLQVRNEVILSPVQLRDLANEPLVTIGSHSITHPRVAELSPEEALRELSDSRNTLEEILSKPVSLFSFPHGACQARDLQLARDAGYARTFGIQPSLAFQRDDEFMTGRVAVDPSDWKIEFYLKLVGAYRWLA